MREWRSGSVGASQALGRGFKSRLPLHLPQPSEVGVFYSGLPYERYWEESVPELEK